ncbi:MAG: cofactor-independent phosphoglycerate mutase [Candidatus Auribacterota bacterium]|nr:cofactor-independent phosphoglycerate mutase [Candidatus Auribacterota bacterium]
MKYVIILGDGMADYPLDELDGKTPLEIANTPRMDRLAREGSGGRLKTVPAGIKPGSDVANLSIMGYNPSRGYTGRGPLEAASLNIHLEDDDIAFRCNLVTVSDSLMFDYSAGHISSRESGALINLLEERLGGQGIKFYPGKSYRHILVIKEQLLEEGQGVMTTTPPHDITGQPYLSSLPRGRGSQFINDLIAQSRIFLAEQEINEIRIDLGENPANMIWPWGQGQAPDLESFTGKYGISGALISGVDLLPGIARIIGLDVINVPGATGYFDTDYAGKCEAAIGALDKYDLIYLHVEAPDEAGHAGNIAEKLKAIERIDEDIVGPLIEARKRYPDLRLALLPDHATPIPLRTHVSDPIPFVIWGRGIEADRMESYNENEARQGRYRTRVGHKFMQLFLNS